MTEHEYSHLLETFRELATLSERDPRREELRDRLVTEHMPLAEHIAHRFRHRGEPVDDLEQVAKVGLIHAVDRFDPERGSDFLSFAVPTITGEVRKHFRDTGWAMRVPRRMKELHLTINTASTELSQRNGRAPTARELAAHLGIDVAEVREALRAGSAYHTTPLEPFGQSSEETGVSDVVGYEDSELEKVVDRESLAPLLRELGDRERRILLLRFFGNMTQTEIAQRVGVSQMQVSRLLTRILKQLRERMTQDS